MTEQVSVSAEKVRAIFENIIQGVGVKRRRPLPENQLNGFHPVFALAHHFRGNDVGNPGYTRSPHRGDHITIPFFTEELGIERPLGAIDVGFHKGLLTVDQVEFNNDSTGAALAILMSLETR